MKSQEKTKLMQEFETRIKENEGKQKNNSALMAGSPMYFYCKYCGIETDVLPETYTGKPIICCKECDKLIESGVKLQVCY